MTETERKRVFQTLTEGRHKFYVYALCDGKNVPFYIGKGTGTRVLQHIADAETVVLMMEDNEPPAEISAKLKRLISGKDTVQCVIIKWGLSEKEAFMCESALINLLGFVRNVKIEELTNIANGHASEAEKNSVADVATKARTLEQFLRECAIQSRDISEIRIGNAVPHVAFIKINKLYRECLNDDGTADNEKVKDATRAMWRIGPDRSSLVQYIFALYMQRVVGVYHVTRVSQRVCDEYRAHGTLPGFPEFPEGPRKVDMWKAQFATLDEAGKVLNDGDYSLFVNTLSEQCGKDESPGAVLKKHRTRVYFTVDDNVPPELLNFRDCIMTDREHEKHFTGESPVVFNW